MPDLDPDTITEAVLARHANAPNPRVKTIMTSLVTHLHAFAPELGADIANGARGTPREVRGTVRGLRGESIAGAQLDVWQSDDEGLYDVQHPGIDHAQARGNLVTDLEGRYHFRSILAMPYAIPHDDPYLDSDAVFGVRRSLVADWKQQPDGSYLVEYDFVLNPSGRTA